MKRFVLISVMSTLLPESSWRMVTTLFSTTGVCSTACSCLNTVHITSISASCKVCKIILILSQIIRNTMTRGKHAQTNLLITHMNTSPDLIRDIPAVPRHLEKTTVLDRLGRVGSGKGTEVILARACGIPVGRRSGGRLPTTLVATINVIIFHCFRRDLFS